VRVIAAAVRPIAPDLAARVEVLLTTDGDVVQPRLAAHLQAGVLAG
jgi:hypothetical protein